MSNTDTPYVISGSGEHDATAIERKPIFAVPNPKHGEEGEPALITYDMPTVVHPTVSLKYGELSLTNAPGAVTWLVKEMLGEAAYRALTTEMDKMSPQRAAQVFKDISEKVAAVALGN